MIRNHELLTNNQSEYSKIKDNLIDTLLPIDLIQQLISHLEAPDVQSTALVSRRWKIAAIEAGKLLFPKIEKYSLLIGNNVHASYKNLMINNQFLSLVEIKSEALKIKRLFLKNLNVKNLENLSDSNPPLFFENFSELAELVIADKKSKSIDVRLSMEQEFKKLIKNRRFHVIKDFIDYKSPEEFRKTFTLCELIDSLIECKDLVNASYLANLLSNPNVKNKYLEAINKARSKLF